MLTLGVEVLRVRPWMAETATTKVTREMREARRMEEDIVVKKVKTVETLGLKEPDLNTFRPSPYRPKSLFLTISEPDCSPASAPRCTAKRRRHGSLNSVFNTNPLPVPVPRVLPAAGNRSFQPLVFDELSLTSWRSSV